jgi:hypothetical protein
VTYLVFYDDSSLPEKDFFSKLEDTSSLLVSPSDLDEFGF